MSAATAITLRVAVGLARGAGGDGAGVPFSALAGELAETRDVLAAALVRRGQAGFGAQAWLLRRALDAAAIAPVVGADAGADVVAAIEASAAFLRLPLRAHDAADLARAGPASADHVMTGLLGAYVRLQFAVLQERAVADEAAAAPAGAGSGSASRPVTVAAAAATAAGPAIASALRRLASVRRSDAVAVDSAAAVSVGAAAVAAAVGVVSTALARVGLALQAMAGGGRACDVGCAAPEHRFGSALVMSSGGGRTASQGTLVLKQPPRLVSASRATAAARVARASAPPHVTTTRRPAAAAAPDANPVDGDGDGGWSEGGADEAPRLPVPTAVGVHVAAAHALLSVLRDALCVSLATAGSGAAAGTAGVCDDGDGDDVNMGGGPDEDESDADRAAAAAAALADPASPLFAAWAARGGGGGATPAQPPPHATLPPRDPAAAAQRRVDVAHLRAALCDRATGFSAALRAIALSPAAVDAWPEVVLAADAVRLLALEAVRGGE